jgi:hypothetical protein
VVQRIARFVRHTAGQDLLEYVLLGSVISLLLLGTLALGGAVNSWYVALARRMPPQSSPAGGPKSNCSDTGAGSSHGKCR